VLAETSGTSVVTILPLIGEVETVMQGSHKLSVRCRQCGVAKGTSQGFRGGRLSSDEIFEFERERADEHQRSGNVLLYHRGTVPR
jgi:hypothetical protein